MATRTKSLSGQNCIESQPKRLVKEMVLILSMHHRVETMLANVIGVKAKVKLTPK